MRRLLPLTATLSAIFAPFMTEPALSKPLRIISEYPKVANPEEYNPICYMETSNNITLNLESICRNEVDNNRSTDTANNQDNSSENNTPNRNIPPSSIIVSPSDRETIESQPVGIPVDEEMVDIDGDNVIEENVVDTDNDGVVDLDEDVVDLDGDGVIESDTSDEGTATINDNGVVNSNDDREYIDIDSEEETGADTFVQPNLNDSNVENSGTEINRPDNQNVVPNTPYSQPTENAQPDIGVDTINPEIVPGNNSQPTENSQPDIGVDTINPQNLP